MYCISMSVFHCNDCNFAVDIKKWFGLIFTDFKIDIDFTFAVDVTQSENPLCRQVPVLFHVVEL